jgi:hypothetical protein
VGGEGAVKVLEGEAAGCLDLWGVRECFLRGS